MAQYEPAEKGPKQQPVSVSSPKSSFAISSPSEKEETSSIPKPYVREPMQFTGPKQTTSKKSRLSVMFSAPTEVVASQTIRRKLLRPGNFG